MLVAVAVAVVVAGSMARAESERSRWGVTTEVVVAARPLEVGSVLDDTTTRIESRPAALVPAGALEVVPGGQRVAATIAEGEVLVEARVAGPGRGPSGAGLAEGDALLAVPLGVAPLSSGGSEPDPIVQVGDRVDLYGSDPADVAGSTSAVARAAVAAAVEPGRVVLRIRRSDAAASAAAVLGGPTTMVVVG